MKLNYLEIKGSSTLPLNIDLKAFNEEYKSETIKSFNKLDGVIKLNKVDQVLIFDISIESNLTLISSFSLKEFNKDLKIKETLYFTNQKEYESDDCLLIENEIDVDNIVFSLLLTSLPLKIHADDEKEIKGEGYRVIKEEDLEKDNEEHSSPFDILSDLDL